MKSCTPLWREAHFEVKSVKIWRSRTAFGSCDVEKVHTVVARSTFRSQNVQNTSASEHFWKLRCSKSVRHCGAKHNPKSKCTKHLSLGALLEVETPLWHEAHFDVKIYKTPQPRSTFRSWDVQKVYAIVARSTIRSQNVQNTSASEHFWKLRRRCGAKHISKSKCTKHHMFGPLLDVEALFCVAGARDSPPCQKWVKREGFVAFPKTMAAVGHLKRICKDEFRVAGAVQETCSSEMLGGQAADFLRGGLHFRASDLQVCEDDFAWQVQHFVWLGNTWHHFFVVAGAVL